MSGARDRSPEGECHAIDQTTTYAGGAEIDRDGSPGQGESSRPGRDPQRGQEPRQGRQGEPAEATATTANRSEEPGLWLRIICDESARHRGSLRRRAFLGAHRSEMILTLPKKSSYIPPARKILI